MDLQQFAVYFTLAYAVLSGLHVITAGLASAFPSVATFGVIATWTGMLALDVQKLTGIGADNRGTDKGMRGFAVVRLQIGIAAAGIVFLIGCKWFTPSHVKDVSVLAACIFQEADKIAPGRIPTAGEAATIAVTCGLENADSIVDLVSAHRAAAAREETAAHPGGCK